jgi:hypothetical protein
MPISWLVIAGVLVVVVIGALATILLASGGPAKR